MGPIGVGLLQFDTRGNEGLHRRHRHVAARPRNGLVTRSSGDVIYGEFVLLVLVVFPR